MEQTPVGYFDKAEESAVRSHTDLTPIQRWEALFRERLEKTLDLLSASGRETNKDPGE